MCGIFGFVSKNTKEIDLGTRRMIAQLNHTRGVEGFGIVDASMKDGKLEYRGYKTGESIIDLLKNADRKELFDRLSSPLVLCHTRRASPGGPGSLPKTANSHPFQVGKTVMAHNGYISNHQEIAAMMKDKENYKDIANNYLVDSHILCAAIDCFGTDALKKVRGKAALWWFNLDYPDKVYIWCWKQDLALLEKPGLVAFSSDIDHMHMAGIYEASKMDPDLGQLFEIDVVKRELTRLQDIKGDEYVAAAQSSNWRGSTERTSLKDYITEYPAGVKDPNDMLGFGLMNGLYVGFCGKCQAYVEHWNSYHDESVIKCGGLHHCACGSLMYPLKHSDRLSAFRSWLFSSDKSREMRCRNWFSVTTHNQRQLSPSVQVDILAKAKIGEDVSIDTPWEWLDDADFPQRCIEAYSQQRGCSPVWRQAVDGFDKPTRKAIEKRGAFMNSRLSDPSGKVDPDLMSEEEWCDAINRLRS